MNFAGPGLIGSLREKPVRSEPGVAWAATGESKGDGGKEQ